MQTHLAAEFEALRGRVEHEAASVILVTSAKSGDGADLTAYGLAEALVSAGHSTALVDASGSRHVTAAEPAPETVAGGGDGAQGFQRRLGATMTLIAFPSSNQPNGSATAMAESIARLRNEYRFTIIDGGALPENETAAMLCGLADAAVLTVRKGRMSCRADDVLVSVVGRAGQPVLGVVTVERAALNRFVKADASQFRAHHEIVPLRRAVAR